MNWSRLAAAYLIGVVTALCLLPALMGPQVQRLRLERDTYRTQAELLQGEVTQLKQALSQGTARLVVERINVEVKGPGDRVVQEAQRRLKQRLIAAAQGRSIERLSPVMLQADLQGMLMQIDGVQYRFEVRLLSLGVELSVYGELVRV